ncbi:PAS domain S-box protein [Halobacteria archaeon AArc-m2/3/4]|uniref:histidine kinase n=1 Tax=Natronoglomus mannanivorans TaxID=2979990 RepID=A0ABT2QCJ3_9EURY|nr:PAS domain S-box protein [Halobacteria archaeon AArc-m2/3/4]
MNDSMHVVYVDSTARDDALTALKSVDGTLDHVTTLADCLDRVDEATCVVTESTLPDATGVEICERIRARAPDVSLVVFTGHGTETLAGEVVAAGADGYVPKSQGVETLVSRVVELLVDRSGTERASDASRKSTGTDSDVLVDGDDSTSGNEDDDIDGERTRADALEELQETAHELMRANFIEEIGTIVVEAIEDVVDQPRAGVRLYDEETNRLEIVAMSDELRRNDAEIGAIGPGEGPFWDAYERQESIVVDDASTDIVPYELDISLGSVAIQPLGEHGLLIVGSPGGTELGVSDVHLVNVFAATVEAALDRATRQQELERTKTIVEAVGDGVYALDHEGHFVTVNDTLTAVTGYTREQLLGEHVSAILTDESLERGTHAVRAVLEADDDYVVTYELTLETIDGDRLPCEVNMTVLRSDGEFDGTAGVVRDISDRKAMERELRDRKEKTTALHGIVSTLEECTTEQEVYERTVDAAEGILNFDVCVVDSVHGEYLVKEAISSMLNEGEYVERMAIDEGIAGKTYRNQRTYRIGDITTDDDASTSANAEYQSVLSVPIGDRGVFQAVSTRRAAFDQYDEELAELLVSHVSDALERLAFECQLREERDRFAALFENVPDAVVSAHHPDDEPIVERVNPAFERVFGYEQSELAGESLDRFIVPPEAAADADTLNRHGARGEIVEREVKRRTTDGLRDFMMRVVPMELDESTSRTFGVYTDITEQKQRQKRVEILNRVLRHDLRNGMNIINGCAEMLADVVEDDTSVQYADAIQERAGELIGLAEKTRAVERTLDRGDAATGPVDVVESVESAVESVEEDFPEAAITCSLPDRAHARADDMLQTAIFHIVENAVEHNDMPTAAIDIDLETKRDDGTLRLSVADNGPGIPTEERELLQEDQEITQLRHASGLGLWLVNWVVTQSGGTLSFDTNDPRGTVVTLEVPYVDTTTSEPVHSSATALD